ncbi:hypothetical protein JKP88DRAFT_273858 [Tribonema minus]|uniref:Uncharacterized protein n=1 Tax=Tribonema minus TaxID=303371 RepID=A0A835YNH5_9STRA|nr:hypothetical protein JKP88DRAFT_273858 [Tribonema minus]
MVKGPTKRERACANQYILFWDSLKDNERTQAALNEYCRTIAVEQSSAVCTFKPTLIANMPNLFSHVKKLILESTHPDRVEMAKHCSCPDISNGVRARGDAILEAHANKGILDFHTTPIIQYSATVALAHGDITGTTVGDWWELFLALMVLSQRRFACIWKGRFKVDPEKPGHVVIDKLSKNQKKGEPFSFPIIYITPEEWCAANDHLYDAYDQEEDSLRNGIEARMKNLYVYNDLRVAYRKRFAKEYTPHHSRGLGAASGSSSSSSSNASNASDSSSSSAGSSSPSAGSSSNSSAGSSSSISTISSSSAGSSSSSSSSSAGSSSGSARKRSRDEDGEDWMRGRAASYKLQMTRAHEMLAAAVALEAEAAERLIVTGVHVGGVKWDFDGGDGGAIYNGGDFTCSTSTFATNNAHRGGAISNGAGGDFTCSDSTFATNTAGPGGAVNNDGVFNCSDSTFANNKADSGGAIYNENGGKFTCTSSTFATNTADSGGGAIYNDGDFTCTSSTFANNKAGVAVPYGVPVLWRERAVTDAARLSPSECVATSVHLGSILASIDQPTF